MGHSKEAIDRLPPELNDAYYYYFRLLPHYQISLISLMANVAPAIDSVQLAAVQQKVLFLLGTADTFASITTGKEIAAAMPNCEFHAIEGAGHLPWLENPGECGRLINHFLAEHTRSDGTTRKKE